MNKVFELNFNGEFYWISATNADAAKQEFCKSQEVRETEFTVDDTMRELPFSEWSRITFNQEDRLKGLPDKNDVSIREYMQVFGTSTGLICTTAED